MIEVRKLKKFDDVWKIIIGNPHDSEDVFLLPTDMVHELTIKLKEAGF